MQSVLLPAAAAADIAAVHNPLSVEAIDGDCASALCLESDILLLCTCCCCLWGVACAASCCSWLLMLLPQVLLGLTISLGHW